MAARRNTKAAAAEETAPVGTRFTVPAGAIVRWPDGTTATTHGYALLNQPGPYCIDGKVIVTAIAPDAETDTD